MYDKENILEKSWYLSACNAWCLNDVHTTLFTQERMRNNGKCINIFFLQLSKQQKQSTVSTKRNNKQKTAVREVQKDIP